MVFNLFRKRPLNSYKKPEVTSTHLCLHLPCFSYLFSLISLDEEDFSLDLLDNTTIDGHKDESSSEEEKEEEHSVFGKKGAAKIDFITEDGLNVCKRLNRREEWADVMGTADSEGAASQGETKD